MENAGRPTSNALPVIEMAGVSVGAKQDLARIVLEEVNWTVRAGEYWVIAGMHDSGKSDLVWTTGGIMPPQAGTYRLFGNEMPMYHEDQLSERLRLGLVFESGQLLHQLSVRENIALPLRYHRHHLSLPEAEERIRAMLELTELTEFAHVMPGNLGRNWQKRVGLARALMLEPELLVLDRPVSGLDPRHASWWVNFLERWRGEQALERPRTIIVTVEDLRPWRNRDCHFALLKKGRLVPLGRRPAFHEHPEPLLKELLAEELFR